MSFYRWLVTLGNGEALNLVMQSVDKGYFLVRGGTIIALTDTSHCQAYVLQLNGGLQSINAYQGRFFSDVSRYFTARL